MNYCSHCTRIDEYIDTEKVWRAQDMGTQEAFSILVYLNLAYSLTNSAEKKRKSITVRKLHRS